MTESLAKLRTFMIRGLAVVAVLLTYAVTTIGTVGIAGLGLTATSTPAQAWWYRGGYRRGYWRGYYPRRYWYRRRWW
jgi:hypothetical protein